MTGLLQHLAMVPPWVALAVVFAVPALEASAFVGFLFPGETALLVGGVLASQGAVPVAGVLAAGILGAIAGDAVGYLLGRRWGRRMLHATVGRFVRPEHLDRAEEALARRGGWSVFLGRFTLALRVLVPGLAGMAGMRYRTFAVFNVAGAVLWGGGMVLAGYLAGHSWHAVAHAVSGAGAALTTLVLCLFAGYVIRRRREPCSHRSASRAAAGEPALSRASGQTGSVDPRRD
jgi:membrane protein DedA with SNARE-associated domain